MGRKPRLILESGMTSPLGYVEECQYRASPEVVEKAVATGACELAYQPIMLATDPGTASYYEGLIRIFDPKNRIIPARDFIHMVEDTETGRQIDLLALTKTIRTLEKTPGLHLSVNASARSIGYAPWTDKLSKAVRKSPDLARRMTIEISEKSVMLLPEIAARFISDMQPTGLRFSLDNFGVGFTSIQHLRDIPFETLKLDGRYIRGVADSSKNQGVVQGVISLAHHLGMNVIAEMVECKADMHWLQRAGIAGLQGYLFGIPTLHPKWDA